MGNPSLRDLTEELEAQLEVLWSLGSAAKTAVGAAKDVATAAWHLRKGKKQFRKAAQAALTGKFGKAKKHLGATATHAKKYMGPAVRTVATFVPAGKVAGAAGKIAAKAGTAAAARLGAKAATSKAVGKAAGKAAAAGTRYGIKKLKTAGKKKVGQEPPKPSWS